MADNSSSCLFFYWLQ